MKVILQPGSKSKTSITLVSHYPLKVSSVYYTNNILLNVHGGESLFPLPIPAFSLHSAHEYQTNSIFVEMYERPCICRNLSIIFSYFSIHIFPGSMTNLHYDLDQQSVMREGAHSCKECPLH